MKATVTPLALAAALLAPTVSGEVAYREIFPSGPSAAANGWQLHIDAQAHDVSKTKAWGNAPGAGNAPAVNSQPVGGAAWKGFLWLSNGSRYMLWTDEATIPQPLEQVSWHMATRQTDAPVRVALQIDADGNGRDGDDPWFVSAQTFANAAGDTEKIDQSQPQTLNVSQTAWHRLDFAPGRNLPAEPGDAADLPAGPVVAFGLYVTNKQQTHVFDTFAIDTAGGSNAAEVVEAPAPEPAATARDGGTAAPRLVTVDEPYQFDAVSIGGGGYFVGVRYHPAVPGLTYARSDVAGPWMRDRLDQPWRIMMLSDVDHHPAGGVAGLAPHPTDRDTVYAAIGAGRSDYPSGLYKTTDGGQSWTRVHDAFVGGNGTSVNKDSRKWGESVVADPNDGDVVYFGTRRDGILRTLDGGTTWTTVRPQQEDEKDPGTHSLVVDPSEKVSGRSRTVYAAVHGKGVFRSTDGGDSFAAMDGFNALPGSPDEVRWMDLDPRGTLYVAHNKGLARYDGSRWADITPPQSGGLAAVAADPHQPGRIAVTGSWRSEDGKRKGWALFRSTNAGDDWMRPASAGFGNAPNGLLNGVQREGTWHLGPGLAIAAVHLDPHHEGGAMLSDAFSIYRTKDIWTERSEWVHDTEGAENIVTIALHTPPASADEQAPVLVAGVSDVRGFRFDSPWITPAKYIAAPGEYATYVTSSDHSENQPQVIYAAKYQHGHPGRVLRSDDGGMTWKEVTAPGSDPQGGAKIAVSATDPDRVVYMPGHKDQRIVYTNDGGKTWKPALVGATGAAIPTTFMDRNWAYNFADPIAADRVDGDTFYAYRKEGGQFWVSRDGGVTWMPTVDLPDANPADDISPVTVASVPGRAGEVWVSLAGRGLWRSADYGQSFERIAAFEGHRPTLVAFGAPAPDAPLDQPAIYVWGRAAGDQPEGLYRSTDGGETWGLLSPALYRGIQPRILAADRQVFGRVYFGNIYEAAIYFGQPNPSGPTLQVLGAPEPGRDGLLSTTFSVDDAQTPPAAIGIDLATSDPQVLPLDAVRVESLPGDGSQRRLTIDPARAGHGRATLTVTARDGALTGTRSAREQIEVHLP